MKRDSRGIPATMVHRWGRPPPSCLACRAKKRRCDRELPCMNCKLRNIDCAYDGSGHDGQTATQSPAPRTNGQEPGSLKPEDVLYRLRHLEEAVFNKSNQTSHTNTPEFTAWTQRPTQDTIQFTPFGLHVLSSRPSEPAQDPKFIASHLPPRGQARELLNHFVKTLQPTIAILHIPSTRELMEETYEKMATGSVPDMANLILFLVIFAGGSLAWSSQLLERLNATQAEARAAFTAYSRLALSVVEDDAHPVAPSTIALASMSILSHLITNSDGFGLKIHMLRMRCLLMMRELRINRLDTPASVEERRLKGCNMIEIEVQRRIWWSMVASDWLIGFSGGHHEGAYIYQTKHMQVNYPANTDDEFITPTSTDIDLPSSVPTAMSGFLFRVKTANLCREIVDDMPSVLLDDNEADYNIVLAMDEKFQTLFKELPWFLKLDPENVEKSKEVVKQRPWIAFGRIAGNFSLHSRLCRLHRPYHLEGMTNPKYAYSHEVCIRSAQTVLELRRQMDEAGARIDIQPSRFWTVMQHVFVAALVLATDVSFSPDAPDAETRKAKVLMAYQILESSKQESSTLVESIQRNLQILMSTLQKERVQQPRESTVRSSGEAISSGVLHDAFRDEPLRSGTTELNWDQLWTEFLAVAPDLDAQQWNSLLDDVDLNPALF